MRQRAGQLLSAILLVVAMAGPVAGQSLDQNLKNLVETPAVTGHEGQLASLLRIELAQWKPQVDELGDVIVTIGSGSPRRLLVTPIDEPGYVVSGITSAGYLRVQRLPQFPAPNAVFDELFSAEPVTVFTAAGQAVDGVVAGPSVHLEEGLLRANHVLSPRQIYIDIGADSAAGVRQAGVDLLDPVALDRTLYSLGPEKLAGMAVDDRFGAAAILELLHHLDPASVHGTLVLAFVTQERAGAHGLQRVMDRFQPDEMIYIGSALPVRGPAAAAAPPPKRPGAGVLIEGLHPRAPLEGLGAELQHLAGSHGIPLATAFSASPLPPGYLPEPPLPARFVHLSVATAWPATPAATIDSADLAHLAELLELYLGGSFAPPATTPLPPPVLAVPAHPSSAPSVPMILKDLVQTSGVSGQEERVREAVLRLLPPWVKPTTDPAGNLVFHWNSGQPAKGPSLLFDAHMDEIGFEVRSIDPDGTLEVFSRGGGYLEYFLGHPAIVLTSQGPRPGVMELPDGWQTQGLPARPQRGQTYRVDVGATSAAQARSLGFEAGDMLTVPKKYHGLLGTRAAGRSMDDRVGDTALVAAAWALGPDFHGNVTFLWTTEEELGLDGAAAYAARVAKLGREPQYVFAIDTFVSADSPLESKEFADALVGHGFVVRAVDNSNIVPLPLVAKMVALARANGIPVQYGVTGGGNDGSAYLRYGATDVALGWAMRYSHSPGEVVDTLDVDGLARIVVAACHDWE